MQLAQDRRWFPTGFWLALAVIFLHALTPSATPWRAAAGSAFNGFTRDVSLGPSRAAAPEKDQRYRDRRGEQPGMTADRTAAPALPAISPVISSPIRPAAAIAARAGLAARSISPRSRRARAPPQI